MNDLIVDGNSLFARCWYAVHGNKKPSTSRPEEEEEEEEDRESDPAEGTKRVFIQSILQFLDPEEGKFRVPIHRTLFCWDGKSKTDKGRDEKPPEYKDTRREIQEALLTLFGTENAWHKDFEADDIVATAAFDSTAEQVYVVSGDKDLMQLQGGNIIYYCLNAKQALSALSICRKFGVKRPSQVAIAQAIIGDPGDGLAGIPKWGPKKSAMLFESVTPDMDFPTALETIRSQIPGHLLPFFDECLDKTLLHSDVPDVPAPAELAFCTHREMQRLKIEGISQGYERVANLYQGESAMDAMLAKDARRDAA